MDPRLRHGADTPHGCRLENHEIAKTDVAPGQRSEDALVDSVEKLKLPGFRAITPLGHDRIDTGPLELVDQQGDRIRSRTNKQIGPRS